MTYLTEVFDNFPLFGSQTLPGVAELITAHAVYLPLGHTLARPFGYRAEAVVAISNRSRYFVRGSDTLMSPNGNILTIDLASGIATATGYLYFVDQLVATPMVQALSAALANATATCTGSDAPVLHAQPVNGRQSCRSLLSPPVCGTDGLTYASQCDLDSVPKVELAYASPCVAYNCTRKTSTSTPMITTTTQGPTLFTVRLYFDADYDVVIGTQESDYDGFAAGVAAAVAAVDGIATSDVDRVELMPGSIVADIFFRNKAAAVRATKAAHGVEML